MIGGALLLYAWRAPLLWLGALWYGFHAINHSMFHLAQGYARQGMSAYVNDAKVITADIRPSNGIVHAINRVLIPPGL